MTANPPGGSYYSPQNVVLAADETSTIYYTTDGSNPTSSSSQYQTPLAITISKVLKYFGVDTSGNPSLVKTENYSIYALQSYNYWVNVPYKKGWYKQRYQRWYKKWYRSGGRWSYKLKSITRYQRWYKKWYRSGDTCGNP
ncbi:MAG: hypothetical protein BME94_08245 [Methanobacteriales archaeon Met13]